MGQGSHLLPAGPRPGLYDRAAFREAVAAFGPALQALAHQPEDGDTRVLASQSPPRSEWLAERWQSIGGAAPSWERPEARARALDDRARLGRVLAQMARVLRIMGDHDGAIATGQQALELAVELGESVLQGRASHPLGQAYFAIGDFGRAAELLRQNVGAEDGESGTPSTDYGIQSRAWLARTLGALGAFAEGRRHGEEALRLATLVGRGDTGIAFGCLGELYLTPGDLEHAIRVLDQGLALCRASGNRDCSSDRGDPRLCLCAPGAPRAGACIA